MSALTRHISKFIYVLGMLTITVATLLMAMVIYWQVIPYQGLVKVVQPLPVSATKSPQGSMMLFHLNYCVDPSTPVPIAIVVRNYIELQQPTLTAIPAVPPGTPLSGTLGVDTIRYTITERCETHDIWVGIAGYIPVGVYRIKTDTSLLINMFRDIDQTFYTEQFTVVYPPKDIPPVIKSTTSIK